MDEGKGGDHMDQFHGNEIISAVAEENLGEEDDAYEDLSHDANEANMGVSVDGTVVVAGPGVVSSGGAGSSGGGGKILFVGDLHWWTTDAELESELCKYGRVKEVIFYDWKEDGKSKGSCQVKFYDPAAAAACKEGMNGHRFNGKPCVVCFASPSTVKEMGEAQLNRNQQMAQSSLSQARRGPEDIPGGNYQGADNNRSYGRGNWGRGDGQGIGGRGPGGPMMNSAGGNRFGQGMGGTPPLMHPQSMRGQGFDPAFGEPMVRMGGYGRFPAAPNHPFSGILPSFPPVGGVIGLPGVAPLVNPAFFGRGMPMTGTGMMPSSGVYGSNMGMWSNPSMGGRGGDEHGGGRAGESSYREEIASGHQYGEVSHDIGGLQNPAKEKDRTSERACPGSSERRYHDVREPGHSRDVPKEKETSHDHDRPERRHRDDRDIDRERDQDRESSRDRGRDRDRDKEHGRNRDRDRYREDRNRYADQSRYRGRGRSSRTRCKSQLSHEDEHHSRSRDDDYGKRPKHTSM